MGKTTAIRHWLHEASDDCFTAVLVNDFGPMGMDQLILEDDLDESKCRVLMVPGGCVCCTAAGDFSSGMQRILQIDGVQRVLIEPSGIASPGDLIDTMRAMRSQYPIEIRPVVGIVDVSLFDRDLPGASKATIDAGDIVIGNRADLASDDAITAFESMMARTYPPKLKSLVCTNGKVPIAVLDLDGAGEAEGDRPLLSTPSHAHELDAVSSGLCLDASLQFRLDGLLKLVESLAATSGESGILRLKGVFNTDQGWKLIQIAGGRVTRESTAYRRDNRMDWIAEQGPGTDDKVMRLRLMTVLTRPLY